MKYAEKKSFVKTAIKEAKVVVFSKTYWPYADKAKTALTSTGLKNEKIYELDKLGESRNGDVQKILKSMTGSSTVPQVFVNGEYVGGGDDMARKARDGSLIKILKSAGAI